MPRRRRPSSARSLCAFAALAVASCAAAPVVRQSEAVVLSCEALAIGEGDAPCLCVDDVRSWRRARALLGGAVAALPTDYADLDGARVVLAPLPPSRRVAAVTVIDEEDVDVVTLLLAPSAAAADARPRAALLRVARRDRSLAVVLRSDAPPWERTVGTFGLR